jgi:hypothetical protein
MMETKSNTLTGAPPRLINSVVAGFNTVAGHIQLILIPFVLDLFLWFGPHLRINDLFKPILNEWVNTVIQMGSADMTQLVLDNRNAFQQLLETFNLFSVVRTWPIGVPSLMAPLSAMETPIGNAPIQEIASFRSAFLIWLGILALGIVVGSLYFLLIAFFSADTRPQPSLSWALKSIFQTFSLTFAMIMALVALAIPAALVLSISALISPGIAQIILLVMSFFILWSLLPLVFSPHGIFSFGQSALVSILTSTRLVRHFMPGTGMFVLIIILLSEGLDVVWRAAPPNSWMTLVGIAGHAFVTTSLVAASFIYYQGGMRWMQENLQQASVKTRSA